MHRRFHPRSIPRVSLLSLIVFLLVAGPLQPVSAAGRQVYLPSVRVPVRAATTCAGIPGESYASLPLNPPPSNRPAEAHPDLNLALRSYVPCSAYAGLVDINGPTDPAAPQLPGLFDNQRTPVFRAVYRVYDWNWAASSRGGLISPPEVTLLGLATAPGEVLRVPARGVTVGSGYEVFVLYASRDRITLKYTREDNVVQGYTLHVEGVCVEPRLLALYNQLNAAGRGQLPVLRGGQGFGRALGQEIRVAIRDAGSFMDPRSRKDWWRGR